MTTFVHYYPALGSRAYYRRHHRPFVAACGNDHAIRRMIETPITSFARSFDSVFDNFDRMLFELEVDDEVSDSVPDSQADSTERSSSGSGNDELQPEVPRAKHRCRRRHRRPYAETHEDDSQWTVDVEIPGIGVNDVAVTLENGTLQISGKTLTRRNDKKHIQGGTNSDGSTVEEHWQQQFKYSYTLPVKGIDEDNIRASLANGVLHVSVPKVQTPKTSQPRSIAITTASDSATVTKPITNNSESSDPNDAQASNASETLAEASDNTNGGEATTGRA